MHNSIGGWRSRTMCRISGDLEKIFLYLIRHDSKTHRMGQVTSRRQRFSGATRHFLNQINAKSEKIAIQSGEESTLIRIQIEAWCVEIRYTRAPRVGLEPTTLRLTAACSTIELPRKTVRNSYLDIMFRTIYVPNRIQYETRSMGKL